jgi:hypothetical protein
MNNDELKKYLTDKQIASKQKQVDRSKAEYAKNGDRIRQRVKTRYMEKREECIEHQKKYNKLNAEKQKEYSKAYYAKKKSEKLLAKPTDVVEEESVKVDPLHCDTCNINVTKACRYSHWYSNKHLKKCADNEATKATEQDLVDLLISSDTK